MNTLLVCVGIAFVCMEWFPTKEDIKEALDLTKERKDDDKSAADNILTDSVLADRDLAHGQKGQREGCLRNASDATRKKTQVCSTSTQSVKTGVIPGVSSASKNTPGKRPG